MEIKSETKPAKSLHHELGVSLRPRDNDIHPNPHGLGRGGDHVVDPVVSLHAEGQRGIRALREGGQGVTREVTGGKKLELEVAQTDVDALPCVHFSGDRNTPLR